MPQHMHSHGQQTSTSRTKSKTKAAAAAALAAKTQWHSRRNIALGPPVRRAHPASGATWNVQVVRGKMTSRCLWHACRALMLGMVLMFLGAGMATIGYYAEHLSFGQEVRGNTTVRVKNESRGFHLNNLSYVGPIVMGFGGFIVVAACVMTFEARDSAAKVVPARFKVSTTSRPPRTNSSSRRTTGTSTQTGPQSNRWENHTGAFRMLPCSNESTATTTATTTARTSARGGTSQKGATAASLQTNDGVDTTSTDRTALTAALVHFSKSLGKRRHKKPTDPIPAPPAITTTNTAATAVNRSDSVPNLSSTMLTAALQTNAAMIANSSTAIHQPNLATSDADARNSIRFYQQQKNTFSGSRHRCHRNRTMIMQQQQQQMRSAHYVAGHQHDHRDINRSQFSCHTNGGGGGGQRRLHRNAMSVDETRIGRGAPPLDDASAPSLTVEFACRPVGSSSGGVVGGGGGGGGANRQRGRPQQRSDTARRHVLSRQHPIEKDEPHGASKVGSSRPLRNHPSSIELTPNVFRASRGGGSGSGTANMPNTVAMRASSLGQRRTPSLEARSVQTDDIPPLSSSSSTQHSSIWFSDDLATRKPFGRSESARRLLASNREWSTPSDERDSRSEFAFVSESSVRLLSSGGQSSSLEPCLPEENLTDDRPLSSPALAKVASSSASPTSKPTDTMTPTTKRPDSLILKCSTAADAAVKQTTGAAKPQLFRSSSSRLYNHRQRPRRPKTQQLCAELEQIYFISSNKEDEYYDSIDVIDERRSSNFKRSASSCCAAAGGGGDAAGTTASVPAFCRSSTMIYSEYCSDGNRFGDSIEVAAATATGTTKTTTPTTTSMTGTTATSAHATLPAARATTATSNADDIEVLPFEITAGAVVDAENDTITTDSPSRSKCTDTMPKHGCNNGSTSTSEHRTADVAIEIHDSLAQHHFSSNSRRDEISLSVSNSSSGSESISGESCVAATERRRAGKRHSVVLRRNVVSTATPTTAAAAEDSTSGANSVAMAAHQQQPPTTITVRAEIEDCSGMRSEC